MCQDSCTFQIFDGDIYVYNSCEYDTILVYVLVMEGIHMTVPLGAM